MITNIQFVANAKKCKGWGYVLGAKGEIASEKVADELYKFYGNKTRDYYVKACLKWKGKHIVDCSGLVYVAGDGTIPKKTANGYIQACKEQGKIDTIPEIVGLVVWKSGHIGIYIGGGLVIESRGVSYGVVITKLKDRPWSKWGKLPYIEYKAVTEEKPAKNENTASKYAFVLKRILYYNTKRYGKPTPNMTGADVKAVQARLMALGFSVGVDGADGIYGHNTYDGVRLFQKKNKDKNGKALKVDGIVGKNTCEALGGKWEG